jgi:hypothetical protein
MNDEKIVKVQRMFPNCQKYEKCCTKDKDFWKQLNGQKMPEVPSGDIPIQEIKHEQILHNVNGYKIDPKRDNIPKKPEGFEGW